jgi:2-polyprenyl-6-methoxyphenol hydroxylase-like FAD-dependent oxidoreductase
MTAGPVLIVGGGIAGLAAALCLRERGIDCEVAESAREIVPLGVGLQVLPHGARVLIELGLAEALAPVAIETTAIEYRTVEGRLIHVEPCGRHAGLPYPQWSVHRGNLHAVLYGAVRARHGEAAVRAGARLVSFEAGSHGVRASFEDRRRGSRFEREVPALIGADGILSVVRGALHPGEGPPRETGSVLLRGLTWTRPIGDGRTMIVAGEAGRRVTLAPVRPPRRDGLLLMAWVAEIDAQLGAGAVAGDWNRPVDPARAARLFEAFRFGRVDMPALIAGSQVCLSYPMADRDPLPTCVAGRVALIGDAAHPMLPVGDSGSSQALLDAQAIAECIAAAPGDLPGALQAYQARRLGAANAVLRANRERGPERLLELARTAEVVESDRDGAPILGPEQVAAVLETYRRIAGFDRATLEARSAPPAAAGPR